MDKINVMISSTVDNLLGERQCLADIFTQIDFVNLVGALFVKLDVSKTLYFCCYISSCFDRGYLDQTKLSMASGSDRRCASLTD